MDLMADKKYTFLVHTEATKAQIKEAVEKMFEGTKVARVNTMNLEGKNRRRGMVVGKTAKTKKAIVQLTEDSKEIEIFEGLKIRNYIRCKSVKQIIRRNERRESNGNQNI